jgi:hypothetical protein
VSDRYICAQCGGEFDRVRTDAESDAEYARNFPEFKDEPRARVCEYCFNAIVATLPDIVVKAQR